MLEVRLYGNLRRYATDPTPTRDTVVRLPTSGGETVGSVLAQIGIAADEVGNIFVNGRLLPRSGYPILLGYPLAAERPLSSERYLDTAVGKDDRLGIFPRNMSSVVV